MFTLYNYFRSSAAFRVRLALHYKNIPFTYKAVHLLRDGGQQYQDEFVKLNPMREVPTLVYEDQGRTLVLAQSMAIFTYLDKIQPSPRLFPEDPFLCARTIQFCEIVNSGIHPLQNLKVGNYLAANFSADASAKLAWYQHWIGLGLTVIENELNRQGKAFVMGDSISAADFFVLPQLFSARRFQVDMKLFPRLVALEAALLARPEVQKAKPDAQPDFEA